MPDRTDYERLVAAARGKQAARARQRAGARARRAAAARQRRYRRPAFLPMLIVIAVIGVCLAYGSRRAYEAVIGTGTAAAALAQLPSIEQAAWSAYSGQPSYQGISAETLVAGGQVPSAMVGSDGRLYHALGGLVTIEAADHGFTVTYGGVGRDDCITMATADVGTAMTQVEVRNSGGGSDMTGDAMDAQSASDVCAAGANSVAWTFR